MLDTLAQRFRHHVPAVADWSLRLSRDLRQHISVRQNVLQPLTTSQSQGAFITVLDEGSMGYAATSDLSTHGLSEAFRRARDWARQARMLGTLTPETLPKAQGAYQTPVKEPWANWSLETKLGLLYEAASALKINDEIVDWAASLSFRETHTLTLSSHGAEIHQHFNYLTPGLIAVANRGTETQRRTFGLDRNVHQGGLERLRGVDLMTEAWRIAEEACALLDAPNCPQERLDLLLMPGQMILQIHESIGHPLELDRILGDERNYAGTSFVTPEMFGNYKYGSELLNVTFDPSMPQELASYGFDDEGTQAERVYLIRNGILERPLGSATSQQRAGLPGTANARACDWNRPPIDRIANLNVEPGDQSLDDLIAGIERGVLMDTNRSWSIDDSRNKFQFGCEYGRLIENGELKGWIKNPNYRGISATFWRSLSGVGDATTFEVMGVSTCGKGEPNQVIHVGHASPACVFRNVEVFGGD